MAVIIKGETTILVKVGEKEIKIKASNIEINQKGKTNGIQTI